MQAPTTTKENAVIESFQSLDDLFERLRQGAEFAATNRSIEQRDITFGSHVVTANNGILIFGKLLLLEDTIAVERESGAEAEEIEDLRESLESDSQVGRFYGNWFSILEPRGELGYNYAFNCWPIGQTIFEAARIADWNPDLMPPPLIANLRVTLGMLQEHVRSVSA